MSDGKISGKAYLALIIGGPVLGAMIGAGAIGVLQIMSVMYLAPLVLTGVLIAAAVAGAGDGFTLGAITLMTADKYLKGRIKKQYNGQNYNGQNFTYDNIVYPGVTG